MPGSCVAALATAAVLPDDAGPGVVNAGGCGLAGATCACLLLRRLSQWRLRILLRLTGGLLRRRRD